MTWAIDYLAVGLLVAAIALAISDRLRSAAGVAALLSGLLWPFVVVGAAQLALWMALARFRRQVLPGFGASRVSAEATQL